MCAGLLLLLLTQAQFESEYAILGVTPSDDLAAIKRAHRKLALANHPDKNPSCSSSSSSTSTCTDALARINAAYDKIIYSRKQTDAPELSAFFGFSEKLYNIVHDVWGLWESIPQADKDDVASSWQDYEASESYEEDFRQLTILVNHRIAMLLEENKKTLLLLLVLPLLQVLCSVVGLLYLLSLALRPCLWIVRSLLRFVYSTTREMLGIAPKTWTSAVLRPVIGGLTGLALLLAVSASRLLVRVPVLTVLLQWTVLPASLLLSLRLKDE